LKKKVTLANILCWWKDSLQLILEYCLCSVQYNVIEDTNVNIREKYSNYSLRWQTWKNNFIIVVIFPSLWANAWW
jgi:hypothetical protein